MPMAGTIGFVAPELILGCEVAAGDPHFDPFKTDAYSFGVTLQVMLLGEDCADVVQDGDDDEDGDCDEDEREGEEETEEEMKGLWLMPKQISEEQQVPFLEELQGRGRLSGEAFELLALLRR
eukprot:TRINITY_DN24777_c0_g1_i1.p2 TRINITY_DN24777_c0_g1~~TRINITY_DN24777_c0_g1_i1.p2  ORF type:complete len:132 (+),score=46.69 TRINITY_DN24777_c0_g1_i1:32-397(+)